VQCSPNVVLHNFTSVVHCVGSPIGSLLMWGSAGCSQHGAVRGANQVAELCSVSESQSVFMERSSLRLLFSSDIESNRTKTKHVP